MNENLASAIAAVILPTVGRNLYYQPGPAEEFTIVQHPPREGEAASQPLHAHILYVHDEHHVALEVVDHIGNRHVRGDVVLVQDGETPDDGSEYCYWMPYQRGQARNVAAVGYSGGGGNSSGAASNSAAGTNGGGSTASMQHQQAGTGSSAEGSKG